MKLPKFNVLPAIGTALALLSFTWTPAAAAKSDPDVSVPVRITVTAVAKHKGQEPPNLTKEDFLILQNHDRRRVLNAVRESGDNDKLDVYVVVDENIDTDLALDYRELGDFIHELPPQARISVLYALNGQVTIAQNLTDDREAAFKSLRLPQGRIGAGGGIYLSLVDLAKRVPYAADRRAAVIFLSSGIDLFRGVRDSAAFLNPDLDVAIDRLSRSGITVYPIYVSPATHFSNNLFLVSNGQSSLSRLADETGGEAFFQGFNTPISLKPFLEEVSRHLRNQYLVTFSAKAGKKSGYEPIKVHTEMSGVEVTGPTHVFVPVEK